MGIIKYRNSANEPWQEIPALQGAKGDKGDMPDLTGYATEEYVDDVAEGVGIAVNAMLKSYAKLADIPDMSDYATVDYVDKAVDDALASIGIAEDGEY